MLAPSSRTLLVAWLPMTITIGFMLTRATQWQALAEASKEARIEIAPGIFMPSIFLGAGDHAKFFRAGGRGADTAYGARS